MHSLCFKSNNVNEGLVTHFQNFVVLAQRCLVCYIRTSRIVLVAHKTETLAPFFDETSRDHKTRIFYLKWQNQQTKPGGAGGAMAFPYLGTSVNPISTRGADYAPTSLQAPPNFQTLLM